MNPLVQAIGLGLMILFLAISGIASPVEIIIIGLLVLIYWEFPTNMQSTTKQSQGKGK